MSLNRVPVVSLLMFSCFFKAIKIDLTTRLSGVACAERNEDSRCELGVTAECMAHAHASFLTISLMLMLWECSQSFFIHLVIFHMNRMCNSRVTSDQEWISDTDCHCTFLVHSHLSYIPLFTISKFTLVLLCQQALQVVWLSDL